MRFLTPLAFFLAATMAHALPLPDGKTVATLMEARQDEVKRKIDDLTVVQTVTVENRGVTTVNKVTAYVKGEKSRTEIVATNPAAPENVPEAYKKVTSLIIGDGVERWSFHSIRGVQKIGADAEGALTVGGPKRLVAQLADGATVEGEETVNGRATWKIAYRVGTTPVTLWLDKNDFFPVRQEWAEEGVKVAQFSDDFIATDAGVDLPRRTVTMRDGKESAVTLVESVVINSGLDDTLFDVAEVRRRAAAEPAKEGLFDRTIRKIKILLGIQ